MGLLKPVPKGIREFASLLEGVGRELAQRRDKHVKKLDYKWTADIYSKVLLPLKEYFDEKQAPLIDLLNNTLETMELNDMDRCYRRETRGSCIVSEQTKKLLRMVDEETRRITGSRCAVNLEKEGTYTYDKAISDIANCLGTLKKHIEKENSEFRREGRCNIKRGSDLRLALACRVWDKIGEYLNKIGLYEHLVYSLGYPGKDFEKSECSTAGKKMECKITRFPGHKAKIDIEKNTIEISMGSKGGAETMQKLFEELGMDCTPQDNSVQCRGVSLKLLEAAERLACATNMDFRTIIGPAYYNYLIEEKKTTELEPLVKKCTTKEGLIDEACVCKLAIERAKRAG